MPVNQDQGKAKGSQSQGPVSRAGLSACSGGPGQ